MHAVCGRDELLQIIGAVHLLRRGKIVRRGDQAQAFTLRPEQRLLHELAAFVRASPERSRAPPRRAAPVQVQGVGMPARCRKKVVVDLSTQRSMARASFHTVTPSSRKRMQHAEIERDLLEAAARHEQHERALRQMVAEAWDGEPGPGSVENPQAVKRDGQRRDPARLKAREMLRPCHFLRSQNRTIFGRHGVRRRRSGTGSPCRYGRPRSSRRFRAP